MGASTLKGLTLATFLWILFFLNLYLPSIQGKIFDDFVSAIWYVLSMILLGIALLATLIVIAESFRKNKLKM